VNESPGVFFVGSVLVMIEAGGTDRRRIRAVARSWRHRKTTTRWGDRNRICRYAGKCVPEV